MKISDIRIRLCRNQRHRMADSELLAGATTAFDFLVITMVTDEGLEGHSFGFAGRGAEMAGRTARDAMKPFFLGRDPLAREKHWRDFRTYDRWWNHVPIYAYGPFDICLWDIAARQANLPLYRLLGEFRSKVPVYGSSLVLPSPEAYAKQALEVKARGWHAYKVHPPGDYDRDLEIYRACREAVGPGFTLMADPVAAYNQTQALRMGRQLERLDYYWFEEPLWDTDFAGLRKLAAALDIPICGTEVLAGNNYSTAECIATGVVDIVRSDVSWKSGVTAVLKTAHLAESFGMNCEIHTAIYHPLEVVNLHCCCAISNCEFFELLCPPEYMDFGMRTPLEIDAEGYAHPPATPGAGFVPDWDLIDNCTIAAM
jgi:L-alanine-DL-glutamate epimerase-like enolase superfamily enzyme